MSRQTRVVIIVGSIVAALLVAVLVVGIVLLNTINGQAAQQAYYDCMARYGFEHDEAPPIGVDADNYIDAMADAAARCSR